MAAPAQGSAAQAPARLVAAIEELLGRAATAALAIACSGGMDSTLLLHCAARSPALRARGLRVLHVDHGLHPEASRWAQWVHAEAGRLDLPCQVLRVEVDPRGRGLEAAAREARQAAFAAELGAGEILLAAQHQDDQAETVLLRLLRGAALDGLAAMRAWRPLGEGVLARPWLAFPRTDLAQAAAEWQLRWIEDPSNADLRHDRNYLRQTVWPLLTQRFPEVSMRLARFAGHAREVQSLLAADAAAALDALHDRADDSLSIPALLELPEPVFGEALRLHARRHAAPLPGFHELARLRREVIGARADGAPLMRSRGFAWCRYRERLYLLPWRSWMASDWAGREWQQAWPAGASSLDLPEGLGTLRAQDAAGSAQPMPAGLRVSFRRGGERIHPAGHAHHRELRLLLQEQAIPPWRRAVLPLLWQGRELLAVVGLVDSESLRQRWPGLRITHEGMYEGTRARGHEGT